MELNGIAKTYDVKISTMTSEGWYVLLKLCLSILIDTIVGWSSMI